MFVNVDNFIVFAFLKNFNFQFTNCKSITMTTVMSHHCISTSAKLLYRVAVFLYACEVAALCCLKFTLIGVQLYNFQAELHSAVKSGLHICC